MTTLHRLSADELNVANFIASRVYASSGDLSSYTILARAVVEAAHASASANANANEASAETQAAYLTVASKTSYNIAANCWPGWGADEAAKVTPELLALGAQFAQVHVRLVQQLGFPGARQASALWIVAAHALAAGAHVDARASFARAAEIAADANDRDAVAMHQGWIAATDLLAGVEGAREKLDAAVAALESMGTDGRAYAAQFAPALAVFGRAQ